jgi:hypothetical protein
MDMFPSHSKLNNSIMKFHVFCSQLPVRIYRELLLKATHDMSISTCSAGLEWVESFPEQ